MDRYKIRSASGVRDLDVRESERRVGRVLYAQTRSSTSIGRSTNFQL